MKIVYLGTPDFAVLPLEKMIKEGYNVIAVVTQPDRPVGRKQILTPSPVKQTALNHGIKVLQYNKIKNEGVEDLKILAPDLMVTCAYGQILSQEILDIPRLGTINIHASLLPELRGSSPIQWAIIEGKKETGVTIMMTDIGVDTGDIILQEKVPILDDETGGELFDKLSVLGAEAIIKALKLFESGTVNKIPQNHELATHTKMLNKESGKIDFNNEALEIHNLVRGVNPWPVAHFILNGEVIKVYKTKIAKSSGSVGEILSCSATSGFIIGCGNGTSIELLEVQRAGGKRMNATDFLRGFKIEKGIIVDD